MAKFRWGNRDRDKNDRPAVTDDFIYDDPDQGAGASAQQGSDTPEEALRKLQGKRQPDPQHVSVDDFTPDSFKESENAERKDSAAAFRHFRNRVQTTGTLLNDDEEPGRKSRPERRHPPSSSPLPKGRWFP